MERTFTPIYHLQNHAELALLEPFLTTHGMQYFVINEYASRGALAAVGDGELILMVARDQVDQCSALLHDVLGVT